MLEQIADVCARVDRHISAGSIFRPNELACGDHGFTTQTSRATPGAAPLSGDAARRGRAAFTAPLAAALAAGDVAAVLLRLAAADERALINSAKTLGPVVQDKGAALLLDGHADLVARAGADGAHLTGMARVRRRAATAQAGLDRWRRRPCDPP